MASKKVRLPLLSWTLSFLHISSRYASRTLPTAQGRQSFLIQSSYNQHTSIFSVINAPISRTYPTNSPFPPTIPSFTQCHCISHTQHYLGLFIDICTTTMLFSCFTPCCQLNAQHKGRQHVNQTSKFLIHLYPFIFQLHIPRGF